jgi:hypothetical protein
MSTALNKRVSRIGAWINSFPNSGSTAKKKDNKPYLCNCGKRFANLRSLKRHAATMAKNGDSKQHFWKNSDSVYRPAYETGFTADEYGPQMSKKDLCGLAYRGNKKNFKGTHCILPKGHRGNHKYA